MFRRSKDQSTIAAQTGRSECPSSWTPGYYDSLLFREDAIFLQLHVPSMILILSDRSALEPLSIVFAFAPLPFAVRSIVVVFRSRTVDVHLQICCLFAELDNELLKGSQRELGL